VVSDLDAGHIHQRVPRARSTLEGNSQIAGAWPGLGGGGQSGEEEDCDAHGRILPQPWTARREAFSTTEHRGLSYPRLDDRLTCKLLLHLKARQSASMMCRKTLRL